MASRHVTLIGAYLSELCSATATDTASGYAASNVVTLDRNLLWRANSTGTIDLVLDLGAAKSVSAVCIANHNGNLWSGAVLQRSPDNSTWTTVCTLSGLTAGQDYFQKFAAQSYQFWRIRTTGSSAPMQVGIFYLGTPTVLTYNPWTGWEDADQFNVERATAQSGAIVAEQWGRRLLAASMSWGLVETTARDQLRDFLRVEGGPLRPWWYAPRDDSADSVYGRAYLVRLIEVRFAAKENVSGYFEMSLSFLEEA